MRIIMILLVDIFHICVVGHAGSVIGVRWSWIDICNGAQNVRVQFMENILSGLRTASITFPTVFVQAATDDPHESHAECCE
jgi:hypothetical protein